MLLKANVLVTALEKPIILLLVSPGPLARPASRPRMQALIWQVSPPGRAAQPRLGSRAAETGQGSLVRAASGAAAVSPQG
jgi:hypothetical protein